VDSSVVGYDGGKNVREERRMAAETSPPPSAGRDERSGEHSSIVPRGAVVVAIVVLALTIVLIVYGYLDLPGSGWIGVADKKFWNYLQLLIVPAALALGVYWLNRAQQEREHQAADRREAEREAHEAAQRKRELEVQNRRAQDEALQAYLDQMSQLLLDKDKPLRQSEEDAEARTLARARTLTVLTRLDSERKESVVQFLYESGLINGAAPIISLTGANLEGVSLEGTIPEEALFEGVINLRGAFLNESSFGGTLKGAHFEGAILNRASFFSVTLEEAYFEGAHLKEANLQHANLKGAHLEGAHLEGAHFEEITMEEADLPPEAFDADVDEEGNLADALREGGNWFDGADLEGAHLKGAHLEGAHLKGVKLSGTDFSGADLSGADLRGAYNKVTFSEVTYQVVKQLITNDELEQLEQQAKSLEGATMPNGQKYDEWRKSKDRGEDG
jgi:uncharacterized protein YjbI with pentapeptide repeats